MGFYAKDVKESNPVNSRSVIIVAVRPLPEILMEGVTIFTIGKSGREDLCSGFVQATNMANIKNKCFFKESS
jgi:hypothetical protein